MGKSQRILIAFYYLFIHNLLLLTHEWHLKKKTVKQFECGHTHAESKFQVKIWNLTRRPLKLQLDAES